MSMAQGDWHGRIDALANYIAWYEPAVVALQEVYLDDNCWCGGCPGIDKQEYLGELLDEIETRYVAYGKSPVRYGVANSARTNVSDHGAFCWAIGLPYWFQKWQGNAVLFNPDLVDFIANDKIQPEGCDTWNQDGGNLEGPCDCKRLYGSSGGHHPRGTRSVFAYPKASRNFFNFYNVHISTQVPHKEIQTQETVDWVIDRHLDWVGSAEYVPSWILGSGDRRVYPPILAGDFNHESNQLFVDYFEDLLGGYIDKILVGLWEGQEFEVAASLTPIDAIPSQSLYEGHRIMVVEIEAEYLP